MDNPKIERFMAAAREFCSVAEAPSRSSIIADLRRALAYVYTSALDLPDPGRIPDETPDMPSRPATSPIVEPLRVALGDDDRFTTVFDATEPSADDPYPSSLAQEVAEIYEDLKGSVEHLETYGPTPDVIWEVRWAFEQHWGLHAVHVLPALHQLAQHR